MIKKLVKMLFGKSGQSGSGVADKPDVKKAEPRQKDLPAEPKRRSRRNPENARIDQPSAQPARTGNRAAAHERSELPAALRKLDLRNVRVVAREDHNISRRDISPNALKVLYRLNEAGFQAFLVGGGVRDLLLGGHPKDFDISTDATPEDVREVFRNSRIIGRRFKITHVRFGQEIIEVTTFRAHHEIETEVEEGESRRHIRDLDSAHSSTGMILRDNVYGSINEDAIRRDFTVIQKKVVELSV